MMPTFDNGIPRVVAAAIIGFDGVVYSLPKPARHCDVGRHMVRECGHKIPFPGGDAQGFLVEGGEFVSREYARICAEHHNQLLPRAGRSKNLYSEDVW